MISKSNPWPVPFLLELAMRGYRSPKEFANKHGFSRQILANTSKHKVAMPTVPFIRKVSDALGLSTHETVRIVWPHLVEKP